ncbi:NAD-dependent epimerase/dehydratase family protein [Haloferax namakaokahaiae]|uniref:NAD-dependent epimerase/dehydratase family protein n=1 Tax=Haloferax namakaokahaiae TaxID=1748331 RepID=A0ABD5ZJA5_9EURY
MDTYLITGGTGLAGNYVVQELVERGYNQEQIIVYDLYPNENTIKGIHDDVTLIRGDVTDTDQLNDTFEQYEPDRVIHLAAYVAHKSWENPAEAIGVNCLGTANVFDAVRDHGATTCLFASSASVYGTVDDYYWMDDPFVNENDPVKIRNPYAATKYTSEVLGRTYNQKYDPNFVGIRIGGVWGRGRKVGATGSLNEFIRKAGLGQNVKVPPYWIQWDGINLSYGKDLGRWFVNVVDMNSFNHTVYNQGNKESYKFNRIVETLQSLSPEITIDYPTVEELDQWGDDLANPKLDCGRWYDELGLTQEWSVEDAVLDFVNYHRRKEGLPEKHP